MRVLHCVVGLAKTVPRDSVVLWLGMRFKHQSKTVSARRAAASICGLIRIFLSESTNWGYILWHT
jgi:hypothetical protein